MEVIRGAGNHLFFHHGVPVIVAENYAGRLHLLLRFHPSHLSALIESLKDLLRLPVERRPRKRLEIEKIDGTDARESGYATEFLQQGFEVEGKKLVLWPSGV